MKITVKGNIGADATLRTVGEGENKLSVCDFSVAENIKKRKDGTQKTVWTKVTLWSKYAEAMAPYLKKGRYVMVTGEGEAETYITNGTVVNARMHINRNVEIDLNFGAPVQESAPWGAEEASIEEP